MIGIIDYGMGNLRSVKNALDTLHVSSLISSDPDVLKECDKLILPGVGAFGDCMKNIHAYNLYDYIRSEVQNGKSLLGICLGMQMLFEESEEKGQHEGFGFLKGRIVKIEDTSVPVPEIGWNQLIFQKQDEISKRLSEKPFAYYVHSYYASQMDEEDLVAFSTYGSVNVPGIVRKGNVMGCQFHPEKSAKDGLEILKYYVEDFV